MLRLHFGGTCRTLAAVLAAASLAACRDATAPHGVSPSARGGSATQDIASAQPLETFYGPERFTRGKGAPETVTRLIPTVGFEAPFVLHVRSGDAAGANRVSSASVRLDGNTVLGPSAFNQQQSEWSLPVTLGSTAVLSVSLASAPGSYLEVWIEGQRSGTLFCSNGTSDASEALRQAIAATPDGGTVLVCAGRHLVSNVSINKPLTITSESGAMATLDGGQWQVFSISNVAPAGTLTISRLRFVGGTTFANVFVGTNAGNVIVSSNEFHPAETGPYGTTGGLSGVVVTGTGIGSVNLDNNTFIGGDVGLQAYSLPGAALTFRGNTFEDQNHAAIKIAMVSETGPKPGPIVIEGNTIRGCGPDWCLFTQHAVTAVGNTVTIPLGRPTYQPLRIDNFTGGTSMVTDNVITGTGAGIDRDLQANYPIGGQAISVIGVSRVERNRITNAYTGIGAFYQATLTGSDNIIEHTYSPFTGGGDPTHISVTMTRNDLRDYIVTLHNPWGAFSAGHLSLQCNYWGSASGPTGITQFASAYVPFSTQPIAGTTVTCDPTAAITAVRVCSIAVDGGPLTVPTLAQAVSFVADGGTVTLCDGTHHASNIQLGSKSLTISAEGPGVPTVDGDGAPVTVNVWNDAPTTNPTISIRGIRFVNAFNSSVSVAPHYGSVVVERSEFHPRESSPYGSPNPGSANGISVTGATGSTTVRDNAFLGGDVGIQVHAGPPDLLLLDNRFDGQTSGGIQIWQSPGVRVEGNAFTNCALEWCLFVQHSPGAQIVGNQVVIPFERRTKNPLYISAAGTAGAYIVTDNVITGLGSGSGNPWDDTPYPIQDAGIQVDADFATISRNRITNAYGGINVTPVNHATGTDNVITHVNAPFLAGGNPGTSTAVFTRNDITDYQQATLWAGFASADLRCNWWGRTSGPLNPAWLQPTTQVSPWASVPIANQPNVVCQ